MAHLLHVLLRILAGMAGALFLYGAVFLYEDEQGKLQDWLEQWWVRVNDIERTATSRYAVFMREVAKLAAGLFDKLLGSKLWSWRALRVSALYSLASAMVCMTFFGVRAGHFSWFALVVLLSAAALVWYGSHRLTIRQPFRFLTHFVVASLVVSVFALSSVGFYVSYGTLGALVVPASFACDITFIAITRLTLWWCTHMERFASSVLVFLVNCLIAFLILVGAAPFYSGVDYADQGRWYWPAGILSSLNAVDAVAASVFLSFGLVAVVHRALWPVLDRALYALQGLGIARRRKLMATLGVTLLTHATLNLPDVLTKVIGTFSG